MAPNNSFVNAVVEAYFYNSKNGGGEYAQKIVTNAKLKVGIVESDKDLSEQILKVKIKDVKNEFLAQ